MAKNPPSRLFNEELGAHVIHINIGPKKEKFSIHRQLICAKSPYFNRMLNNPKENLGENLKENPKEISTRDERTEEVDTFSWVVEWLYRGSIKMPNLTLTDLSGQLFTRSQIKLYVLAEKLEMTDIADIAMEHLGAYYALSGALPIKEDIDLVFTKTKSGSTLRKYMASAFHFILVGLNSIRSHFDEVHDPTGEEMWDFAKTHDELGKEVFQMFRHGWRPEDPRTEVICHYHHHWSAEPYKAQCKYSKLRFSDYVGLNIVKPRPIKSPAWDSLVSQSPRREMSSPGAPGGGGKPASPSASRQMGHENKFKDSPIKRFRSYDDALADDTTRSKRSRQRLSSPKGGDTET